MGRLSMRTVLGGETRSMWRAALLGSGLAICLLVLLIGGRWATAEEPQRPVAAPPSKDSVQVSVIELRLTEHDSLFGRGLDARVQGNTVTLWGTVETRAQRALAERLARVPGIENVDNRITVQPPAREPPAVARANPPLTNAERERRRRSGDEAAAPVKPEGAVSGEAPPARAAAATAATSALPTSAQILGEVTRAPVAPETAAREDQ
jgi:hypothetical protein